MNYLEELVDLYGFPKAQAIQDNFHRAYDIKHTKDIIKLFDSPHTGESIMNWYKYRSLVFCRYISKYYLRK